MKYLIKTLNRAIPWIGGFIALFLGFDYAASHFVHPYYAIVWGTVGAIAGFSKGLHRVLAPPLQFALLLFVILVNIITTNWNHLGWEDVRGWGLTTILLLLYQNGLTWAWSRIKRANSLDQV